jgi:hypothetical protein
MPDQFDKRTILAKLQEKVAAKGFILEPDRSKLPDGTPTMGDLLDAIAEGIAEIISQDENVKGTIKASELKLGPTGLQQPVAHKTSDIKSDIVNNPQFWAWMEAFKAVIQVPTFPEPGMGAPSVFHAALKAALIATWPSEIKGKIVSGSSTVKVTT